MESNQVKSHISKQEFDEDKGFPAGVLRDDLFEFIKKEYPDLKPDHFITMEELNIYRRKLLTSLVSQELGEVTKLEEDVLDSIQHNRLLSENIEPDIEEHFTFGQRIADKIAEFGGSWTFIISFFVFFSIWMIINIIAFSTHPFDPYPFILLNLILSCLAAIQAPIIMMSQNRKEQKDRQRSEHDYMVNLKAELEIKLLNEKIDHLLIYQNKRFLEIQQIQADFLEDIYEEIKKNPKI
ncbi:MAG: DUF1003 domain-containing protein [Bacteroidia bacterium]|nr:DUF1003 domain-containing protein [Bacteroidia bacterium]